MTTQPLTQIVQGWTRGDESDELWNLYVRLQFLAEHLFGEYEPARGPEHAEFTRRLERWLSSVEQDDDRRALFALLDHLYFVGQNELEVLHTAAFEDIVLHWLIDVAGILIGATLGTELEAEIDSTWFCPITDSMEIARFCHLNQITGNAYRPDWRSLEKFGTVDPLREHIVKTGTRHLVLLEDFVGTGNQAGDALEFAAAATAGLADLLCVPLLITDDGLRALRVRAATVSHVTIEPAAVLTEQCHVRPTPPTGGDHSSRLASVRLALTAVHDRVTAGDTSLSAYGWGDLGTLAVLFTNCPNNVPPVIHHQSVSWAPLFPRSSRQT